MNIPESHPRYKSLMARKRIENGVKEGLVAEAGLIAHGRGEAFDYLLGERTTPEAELAEKAAAAHLLRAKNPVISINGNTAVLAGKECIELAEALEAKLEVNIFYRTDERMNALVQYMEMAGAKNMLGLNPDSKIDGLEHARGLCTSEGIHSSDVILVPLEDGDRAKALVDMGKTVITIDLNPLSRTSKTASVTIVDEVSRAIPNITRHARELDDLEINILLQDFENSLNLQRVKKRMGQELAELE
jgi:4-phosphopantoate--beta-alanine ligase